jgi:hypothetical protein
VQWLLHRSNAGWEKSADARALVTVWLLILR